MFNKGHNAGGSKTTFNGRNFEEKTNNLFRLQKEHNYKKINFSKKNFCISKNFNYKKIIGLSQGTFKMFMKKYYNIDTIRIPDELFIIEYHNGKKIIIVIEKKVQNVSGSIETKLWAAPSLKREYELVFKDFEIYYCLVVNNYLKEKLESNIIKYKLLNVILKENNIKVLFGDEPNYFETFDEWFSCNF